ncbi:MAG TPA: DUF883 C-terminal domain-containing protein [Gammaproteobacteria bacterium]|jgi:ElaB/YqjD/DUF883 family membrane-anchored ribosome-binding protein|nr:DUF883 C-terminal domain-containing protein [Gammaproteobacteria bacterium]
MALLKRTTDVASHAREFTSDTAKQLQTRSKYLAHLAAAQGYRAAASAQDWSTKTRDYARRHPLKLIGFAATIAGLLGLGIYRRNRR